MFKRNLYTVLGCAILLLCMLIIMAYYQARSVSRDPVLLMDKYYHLRTSHPEIAQRALQILLAQYPSYAPAIRELAQYAQTGTKMAPLPLVPVLVSYVPPYMNSHFIKKCDQLKKHVLKRVSNQSQFPAKTSAMLMAEAGYKAIARQQWPEAIEQLTNAYQLTGDPLLAMQLGYLYDRCNAKPIAYRYFRQVTRSHANSTLKLAAENALTHLGQLQTKALPAPYFSETFFTPFSQSRFGLTVRPFLTRLGVEQTNRFNTREYIQLRRTDDNRSRMLGQISQLYEDDVQIVGGGFQFTPFASLPIVGFAEAGEAYDLIDQNRPRWRGDLRAGFMYYDQFGTPPAYYDHAYFSHAYFGDMYADVTYFSRYNNNVIGGARTHQGIRLWQYQSSMLNLYLTGRLIADTQRLFYNNFAEWGPGIAIIPTNRFNLQVRFEHVNGVYLPAGAIPNPYNKYYTNNLVQLLFYVKI